MGELLPLASDLSEEGRALSEALRSIFSGLGISVRRYAARRHRDPGSVSRFLNGSRIPPWEFVADLINDVAEQMGKAPTPDAMNVLREVHRSALKASSAPMHAVQLLEDQLAEADRDARATALQQEMLMEALQARQRRIADLQVQLSESESSRIREGARLTKELELQRVRFDELEAERDQLLEAIRQLEEELVAVQARHLEAESRCDLLEQRLASMEGDSDADPVEARLAEKEPPKSQILIVESDAANATALRATLEPLDQDLVFASTGGEALRLSSQGGVSLIIVSVELQGEMSGYETVAQIKLVPESRDIPVIFLTDMDGGHSSFRGYAAGGVDYLVRPVDPWVLRAKAAVFVELHWKTAYMREAEGLIRVLEANSRERGSS
ncbi:response regulator [Streptomyces tirandamycinicus]|uniref:Response regulator n=1 Tax=Streptomyces tirandamycinicus TaxID=2174846 RepID=A0A2S1SUQ9_9ACTN|nr:response regulator [Streptomyces tirandamycinicus]AWI30135.1 response regulator [Streptomyces tirandamycinicus]